MSRNNDHFNADTLGWLIILIPTFLIIASWPSLDISKANNLTSYVWIDTPARLKKETAVSTISNETFKVEN